MTHTTEQERVDTTVFKRLLNDYADCLRNGDFQDAGAALLAVVAEYQQAVRRAPAAPVPQWDGKINPADFNVETFRRSGIGWLVKPANCVRITHVPTGLFEEGVSERSIHTNKAEAWERLSARLEALAAAHPAEGVPVLAEVSAPAAQGMDAPNEWEDIRTLPTCDDLIWLYCQDSNTIDGPIAPEPNLEEYGWSHWAYANAPSTAWIDTAQAKQGDQP